jgi:hypothetical protein
MFEWPRIPGKLVEISLMNGEWPTPGVLAVTTLCLNAGADSGAQSG